jgi:hypothetical protein
MARGSISSEGSGGEGIHHFSNIRLRVTGHANLKMKVSSLDYMKNKLLLPLPLYEVNRIQPDRLVNFVDQRVSFEFSTTELNEWFRINRIVVYMKEIYTSFPGAQIK